MWRILEQAKQLGTRQFSLEKERPGQLIAQLVGDVLHAGPTGEQAERSATTCPQEAAGLVSHGLKVLFPVLPVVCAELWQIDQGLVRKVKELVHEGNIRRITIKNEEGERLIEIPLTIGAVGIVLLSVWAALGAVAALVADCTIVVEKIEE